MNPTWRTISKQNKHGGHRTLFEASTDAVRFIVLKRGRHWRGMAYRHGHAAALVRVSGTNPDIVRKDLVASLLEYINSLAASAL